MIIKEPGESTHDVKKPTDFDPIALIGQILPRGHSFHGYSSASSERVIKILATTEYSDGAPLLGFGVDGDAEMALGRAIATYLQREQDGLEYMSASQYPHITEGEHPGGGHASKFDNIVWGDDFTLYQDGDEVVASTRFGNGLNMGGIEVRAATALEAIDKLASKYKFASSFRSVRDSLNALPNLVWGQVRTDLQTPEVEE